RRYHPVGVAAEFFDDPIGLFAGPLGQLADGGSLTMVIRVKADGTQELTGTYLNVNGNPLSFGPAPVVVGLDANGFPKDAVFAAVAPFTLTAPTSSAAGTVTVNHELH